MPNVNVSQLSALLMAAVFPALYIAYFAWSTALLPHG
jgi:hypothetical protein